MRRVESNCLRTGLLSGFPPSALALGFAWPQAVLVPVLAFAFYAAVSKPAIAGIEMEAATNEIFVEMLASIQVGKKLAIRPLSFRRSGLPENLVRRMEEALELGFSRASQGRFEIFTRTSLKEIYKTQENFFVADLEALLRDAKADIEVQCVPRPTSSGIDLSCKALDLLNGRIVGTGSTAFEIQSDNTFPAEIAFSRLSADILDLDPSVDTIDRIVAIEQLTGRASPLTQYIADKLKQPLQRRLGKRRDKNRRQANVSAVLADGEVPVTAIGRLMISVTRLDKQRIWLKGELWVAEKPVGGATVELAAQTLPQSLLTSVATPGAIVSAEAEAILSRSLDRRSAGRAIRNLARARVVAQALGLPVPAVDAIRDEADAAFAFAKLLSEGLPINERWRDATPSGPGDRIAVSLSAEVVKIGSDVKPVLQAALSKNVYLAGEPIQLAIEAESLIYIGVFAWGADNRVVRVFPAGNAPNIPVSSGETLVLPAQGQGNLLSMPMPEPGNDADHEALIVVASGDDLDFAAIGLEVGGSFAATQQAAMNGARFFKALSRRGLARMAVVFLPYQVINR